MSPRSDTAAGPRQPSAVHELVAADIRARYGHEGPGLPHGRDALMDAYEEALSTAMCLREAIEEREALGQGDVIDAVLRRHHITRIIADRANQLESAECACGDGRIGWHASTPLAVAAWVDHIRVMIAGSAAGQPERQPGT